MAINSINLIKKALKTPLPELKDKLALAYKVYVKKYPYIIVLQTVSACNLPCEHCYINNYGKEIKDGFKKTMTYDEFEKFVTPLIPAIQNASHFQFTTFEPFVNKNIFKMMDRILEINPKITFPILSNALLISDEILAKLRNYPISEFTISLDGADKATVENFKTGSDFEKVVRVMRKFVELKFNAPLQSVFVMHKNNYKSLPEYMDFVNELGCKRVSVNNLLSFTEKHSALTLYDGKHDEEINDIFQQAIHKAEINYQELLLPGIQPNMQGCKACEMLFVNYDGNVTPCDYLAVSTPFYFQGAAYQASPVIFGNILKDKPLDIYRSKIYNNFRDAQRSGKNLPEPCEHCINAYGLLCGTRNKFGKIKEAAND